MSIFFPRGDFVPGGLERRCCLAGTAEFGVDPSAVGNAQTRSPAKIGHREEKPWNSIKGDNLQDRIFSTDPALWFSMRPRQCGGCRRSTIGACASKTCPDDKAHTEIG